MSLEQLGKPQGYLLAYQSSLAGKATCLRVNRINLALFYIQSI